MEVFQAKGGVEGLKEATSDALKGLTNRKTVEVGAAMAKHHNGLMYTALDIDKMLAKWTPFHLWEVSGTVRYDILDYCRRHHIHPIDLGKAGVTVLLPAEAGYDKHPNMFKIIVQPKFLLFFPIYRGGKVVAAFQRTFRLSKDGKALNEWYNSGMDAETNGRLLYTSALPTWGFESDDKRTKNIPLVLVESAVDAIRVARLGWSAVGLGGHDVPAKIKHEIRMLPYKTIIIMLDQDVSEAAVKLQSKLLNIKPNNVFIARITKEKADPASLDDKEVREVLVKTVHEIQVARRKAGRPELSEELENRSSGSEPVLLGAQV